MEELSIKSELKYDSEYCTSSPNQPVSADQPKKEEKDAIVPKKKRRMEIELDFSLVKNEYYKPRERRSVTRYDDIVLEAEANRIKKKINRAPVIDKAEEEESFFCDLCKIQFHGAKHLALHTKQKHNRSVTFTCALCSETFNSNDKLIEHKNTHKDEERNFLCMKCKTAFSDHLEYLKHNASHLKNKNSNYFCVECGREFENRHSYNLHIETHYNRAAECDICHKKYVRIKDHMRSHKRNKDVCVECGKEFSNQSYLKYHMVSHTGVKPYQCLYCGKGFGNRNQRAIHTRYHTGEKPYKCKICHNAFTQITDLKRHVDRMHDSPLTNPLKCEVCSKTFKHKESLVYHMDVHNNTQKYTCHICGYKNHTNSGLRSHFMRVHTEGKKYNCVPCGLAFKTNSDLRKHSKWKKHINNVYGYEKKNMDKDE